MYKYAAIVLVAVFALVVGYGVYRMATDPRVSKEAPIETASTTIQVRTEKISEDHPDYSIDVEYPQFGIASADAEIMQAVNGAIAEIKAQAATDSPSNEGFRKYELFGSVERTHVGNEISASMILSQDFGGAHPLPIALTFNFTRDGNQITLDGALQMIAKTLPQLAAEARVKLNAEYEGSIISIEGADAKAENYQTFEISDSSVTFIFQPYQVTAYAAGMPEVSFPRK